MGFQSFFLDTVIKTTLTLTQESNGKVLISYMVYIHSCISKKIFLLPWITNILVKSRMVNK